MIDWRDCDSETLPNGAEDDYYLGQRRAHRAKNGYFDSVEELLQVRGVTPEIFFGSEGRPGLRDVFTIYPKGQELEINPRHVTPEVLAALFPGNGFDIEELLQQRSDDPEGFALWLQQNLDSVAPGLSAAESSMIRDVSVPAGSVLKAGDVKFTGGTFSVSGDGTGINLEVAAAGNTEVIRAKRKVAGNLKLNDTIEDVLISLTKQYHLLRPLESNQNLFLYVVLDRSKSNLAMARHELRSFEKTIDFS